MNRILLACALIGALQLHAQTFQWNDSPRSTAKSPAATTTHVTTGLALFYPDYYDGNPTALGETFHQNLLTAGHPSLPLGTMVKVTRPDLGLSTTVRINDRGAHCDGCAIYLSKAAAHEIDMLADGQVYVVLDILHSNSQLQSQQVVTNEPQVQIVPVQSSVQEDKQPELVAKGISTPTPHAYRQPSSRMAVKEENAPSEISTTILSKTPRPSIPIEGNSASPVVPFTYQTIDVPISEFAVQLGSYRKYSNAERHLQRLLAQNFTCLYMLKEAQIDGSTLHRVLIAPFTTLAEAEQFVEDLGLHRQMEALVLQTKWTEIGN